MPFGTRGSRHLTYARCERVHHLNPSVVILCMKRRSAPGPAISGYCPGHDGRVTGRTLSVRLPVSARPDKGGVVRPARLSWLVCNRVGWRRNAQ